MDTIQVGITLNEDRLGHISDEQKESIGKDIHNFKSPYGHRYSDYIEVSDKGNIVIKISYPRFYEGVNAYLISSSKKCSKVQNDFCFKLYSHDILFDSKISIDRVDIPFTFLMNDEYNFYSFKKVYQIFSFVYKKNFPNVTPKAYVDIETFRAETLIYASTKNPNNYNSRLIIYDQYNNITTKTALEVDLFEILEKYPDLKNRMRIEVSKRIKRNGFTVKAFESFDIFREYRDNYKEYLLKNILDLEEINKIYDELAYELALKLDIRRTFSRNFNYENFIYKEIDDIHDYEIIRRALKILISNISTRENAITTIRKVLREYEASSGVIVMNTYKAIKEIREVIVRSFID